jgi:hypothetical protein
MARRRSVGAKPYDLFSELAKALPGYDQYTITAYAMLAAILRDMVIYTPEGRIIVIGDGRIKVKTYRNRKKAGNGTTA